MERYSLGWRSRLTALRVSWATCAALLPGRAAANGLGMAATMKAQRRRNPHATSPCASPLTQFPNVKLYTSPFG